MRNFYENNSGTLWGPAGFYDAHSKQFGWSAKRYLAIDQGPMVVMLENYRSGLLWNLFMSAPEVKTGMKKLIFKFWIVNFIMSIILFIIYRIVIIESKATDGNWFENFIAILDILLNIILSTVYLIGILICSLPLFLNLKKNIRNNYYLSLLTFLGLPFIFIHGKELPCRLLPLLRISPRH